MNLGVVTTLLWILATFFVHSNFLFITSILNYFLYFWCSTYWYMPCSPWCITCRINLFKVSPVTNQHFSWKFHCFILICDIFFGLISKSLLATYSRFRDSGSHYELSFLNTIFVTAPQSKNAASTFQITYRVLSFVLENSWSYEQTINNPLP